MSELHLSWLEPCVVLPLVGARWLAWRRDSELARRWCLAFSGATLVAAAGAWLDFQLSDVAEAGDRWSLLSAALGWRPLVIDRMSAPLLPLVALLFFLTQMATVQPEVPRFSYTINLLAEAIVLATYCAKQPWLLVGLMSLGALLALADFQMRRARPAPIASTWACSSA